MRKRIGLLLATSMAFGAANATVQQDNIRIEQQAQKQTAALRSSFAYSYGRRGIIPGFRNQRTRRSIQKSFLPVAKRKKHSNKIHHSKKLKLKHSKNYGK